AARPRLRRRGAGPSVVRDDRPSRLRHVAPDATGDHQQRGSLAVREFPGGGTVGHARCSSGPSEGVETTLLETRRTGALCGAPVRAYGEGPMNTKRPRLGG